MEGEAFSVLVNSKIIHFQDRSEILRPLLTNDELLLDYIYRAAMSNSLISQGITPADASKLEVQRIAIQENLDAGTYSENSIEFFSIESDPDDEFESPEPDLWATKGKSTESDSKATLRLLQLRGSDKFKKLFDNKKNNKLQLWSQIADSLICEGFKLKSGKVGAEKCRQKFANLQRTYILYTANQRKTGSAYMAKPEYFDEIHIILGEKDKVAPKYLLDSIQNVSNDCITPRITPITSGVKESGESSSSAFEVHPNDDTISQSTPTNKINKRATEDRFKSLKKSVKPKTAKDEILAEIRSMNVRTNDRFESFKQMQSEQNSQLIKYMEKQTEQRENFNNMFKSLIKSLTNDNKKKRKRDFDSSDNED